MVQFDPIKMLEWMWQMRRWGQWLVITTVCMTVAAIVLTILIHNDWAWVVAGIMWAILILGYLQSRANLRHMLDDLISNGEHILGTLTTDRSLKSYDAQSERSIERYATKIDEWDASITSALKGTRYERQWMSNAGLSKPEENEVTAQGPEWYLVVWRNWITLRLKRLEDIRNGL